MARVFVVEALTTINAGTKKQDFPSAAVIVFYHISRLSVCFIHNKEQPP